MEIQLKHYKEVSVNANRLGSLLADSYWSEDFHPLTEDGRQRPHLPDDNVSRNGFQIPEKDTPGL